MAQSVLRITVKDNMPYESVVLYNAFERDIPNWFEEEQIVFECKHGLYTTSYSNIVLIHLRRGKIKDGTLVKQLSLTNELSYSNVNIIPESMYGRYNIPIVFKSPKQLVFSNDQGVFITFDEQVHLIQLY